MKIKERKAEANIARTQFQLSTCRLDDLKFAFPVLVLGCLACVVIIPTMTLKVDVTLLHPKFVPSTIINDSRTKHTGIKQYPELLEYHKSMLRCSEGISVSDETLEEMRKVSLAMFGRKKNLTFLENHKNPCWFDQRNKFRCLPYVYLAGMPKSGTTDLYTQLTNNALIYGAKHKEPEWVNRKAHGYTTRNRQMPLEEYTDMFASASIKIQEIVTESGFHPAIAIDGSPSTLWEMDRWPLYPGNENSRAPVVINADLLRKFTPLAKFAIIFRNPVDRLYSHYYHQCQEQRGPCNSFDFHQRATEAVVKYQECLQHRTWRECIHDSCLNNFDNGSRHHTFIRPLFTKMTLREGLYHLYLSDWFKVFPREQFFTLPYEAYVNDPAAVLNAIFRFLGVGEIPAVKHVGGIANERRPKFAKSGPMLKRTRTLLQSFYEPHNRQLADLLNSEQFLWT